MFYCSFPLIRGIVQLRDTGEQGCEGRLASSYWTVEGSELCTEQPGRKAEREGRRRERELERETA